MKIFLIGILLQLNNVIASVQSLNTGVFSGASFGVCAQWDNGENIVGLGKNRKLNPASTMKAVTTGAALMQMGADYQWETNIVHTGRISKGVLDGDLYIVGGGDPMLGSNDADAEPIGQTFGKWLKFLQDKGITEISGDIVGDGSWIEGMREHPSWSYDDIGTYYGTCVSGLNFYENMQQFSVSTTGMAQGQAPVISPSYPDTPWMEWSYDCTAGAEGSGDKLYLYTSDLGTRGVMRGTYGAGKEGKIHCRNNYPERSLAHEFGKYLEQNGIKVKGSAVGISDARDSRSARNMAGQLFMLGSTLSPALSTVISRTNKDSNNMYAELLMRTIGFEAGGSTEIKAAARAMEGVISGRIGPIITAQDVIIRDGSGLSMQDRLTPEWMCDFLREMKNNCADFDTYLNSLVKYSSRCYLKTGSFTGCRCLCGYILPSRAEGKTIVFSIMVNNSELGISAIDREEKLLLDQLARLN